MNIVYSIYRYEDTWKHQWISFWHPIYADSGATAEV